MCFETTESARAKIAKKDITCWKVIQENFSNHFQWAIGLRIEYKPNLLMPSVKIKKEKEWGEFVINKGYHSFCLKRDLNDFVNENPFHFCSTIKRKFIIPAGTRYYENDTQYVSETIMML